MKWAFNQSFYRDFIQMKLNSPIPLIQIDEKGIFSLNHHAKKIFQTMSRKKIAVVAIAGPQRTGKSFLANRLLGRMDGFSIGPTINPCTKGIWMWGQAKQLSEEVDMILLDTQGLNSVERDSMIDAKIFATTILLCSSFVLNTMGAIDQRTIQNLSLIVNISKNIQSQLKNSKASPPPSFYWTLRDFGLDLKGGSSNDYLESCLQQKGEPSQPKNQIRKHIKQIFKQRSCFCFERPVSDEQKLRQIQRADFEQLRPAFKKVCLAFESKVLGEARPKIIQGKRLSAQAFLGILQIYIQTINKGSIPQIKNTLQILVSRQRKALMEQAKLLMGQHEQGHKYSQRLPMDQRQLQIQLKQFNDKIQTHFDQRSQSLLDKDSLSLFKSKLAQALQERQSSVYNRNKQLGRVLSQKALSRLKANFSISDFKNLQNLNQQFISARSNFCLELIKQFAKQSVDPFRSQALANHLPAIIIQQISVCLKKVKLMHTNQSAKLKEKLGILSQNQKNLAVLCKQQQLNIDRLLKQKQKIAQRLDTAQFQLKKRSNKQARTQSQESNQSSYQLAQLRQQNEALASKVRRLTEQLQSRKEVKSELVEEHEPNLINQVLINYKSLLQKLKLASSHLDEFSSSRKHFQKLLLLSKEQHNYKLEVMQRYIQTLNSNKQSLSTGHQLQQKLEDYEQVILKKQNEILSLKRQMAKLKASNDKTVQRLSSLQMELAIQNASLTEKLAFKESLPFLIAQLIKHVSGKKNKLAQSLATVGQQYFSIIKETLGKSGKAL